MAELKSIVFIYFYKMYKKRYFRRRPRKYLRRARSKRGSVSMRIKKYVKNQIHRNIENKERILYAANQPIQTGDVSTMTWPLLPSITRGVNDDNRIANAVKCVKGQIKFAVNLLPYNLGTNPNSVPMWVKVWVVRTLQTGGQNTTLDATTFNSFFRGNGTALSFQSNTLDLCLACNESYVRVLYQKVFKLGNSFYVSGGPTTATGYYDNSPTAKYITINYGKWIKSQLKFSEGSDQVSNHNLYLVFQAVGADGASNSGYRSIEWHYTNTFTFEDA